MKNSLLNLVGLLSLSAVLCSSPLLAGEPTKSEPVEPATVAPAPIPHCEVPCGIYDDQMRFQMMLEDTDTITKAIAAVVEFANECKNGPPSATGMNQTTRWITTKEDHANNIQHIVAQYFLTQRIKSDHKDYTGQLATAHRVMVAAMKCKQDADPATATALKAAIYDLYRAYEGKEPALETEK